MTCKHEIFRADVAVNRLSDTGRFAADVRICCAQCSEPFQFLGLPVGSLHNGAAVSIDGQEARMAICPANARPTPLQAAFHGAGRFDA